MYAIVKTGGKQYRVEEGQTLLVERLPADEGASVKLEPILFRSDEAVFDRDGLGKVTVNARVVGHLRGPKLRVFKFKPKRGYRRTNGHRQELTRLEVTSIEGPEGARRRSAAKSEPKAEAGAAEKETKPTAQAPEPKPKATTQAPEPKPKAGAPEPKAGAAEAKPKATSRAKPPAQDSKEDKPAVDDKPKPATRKPSGRAQRKPDSDKEKPDGA
ncbi:MAG TPA: 50S ribosomal protein L21 [Solirubrobacteraceae bacterium]|nr:50S ribosomal protein L21 [Solirubrobacteraceae bacterium]